MADHVHKPQSQTSKPKSSLHSKTHPQSSERVSQVLPEAELSNQTTAFDLSPDHVLQLQRTLGNQAVLKILQRGKKDTDNETELQRAIRLNLKYAEKLWGDDYDSIVALFIAHDILAHPASPDSEIFAQAVMQFQATMGLTDDGILGKGTWKTIKRVFNGLDSLEESQDEWTQVSESDRMVYVMTKLIDTYGFPVNGAAGIVGNLSAESGVLPSRVEGSKSSRPMRAKNAEGELQTFTPEEIRDRIKGKQGPKKAGIGLAQWTSKKRREGLFEHEFDGEKLGTDILFNMDAQIDYLVTELQSKYKGVYKVVTDSGVSVNKASDDVVYRFEIPGKLLHKVNGKKRKRPRSDSQVQSVFEARRAKSKKALQAYNNSLSGT